LGRHDPRGGGATRHALGGAVPDCKAGKDALRSLSEWEMTASWRSSEWKSSEITFSITAAQAAETLVACAVERGLSGQDGQQDNTSAAVIFL